MEKTKNIIINLILQDFRHQQLIHGLEKLGLEPQSYSLDIISIIAEFMGIEHGNFSNQWGYVYTTAVEQALQREGASNHEELYPIAEECYYLLVNRVKIEASKAA